ncbi:MAG: T9SS type A sorting domain-containing protein [Bacteroidetes bacterium]|nr:T9SS type A sorting domain-containing protein [Bacteroidota bacterium]
MKQFSLSTIAILLLLLGVGGMTYAGTYASGLRVTNADSTLAFDGSFYDGTNALLWFTLNGHADTVSVWVNAGPVTVRKFIPLLNLAPGVYSVAWDGKNDSGKIVPTGRYNFSVFTSDTGNTAAVWTQAWENPVYLGTGIGLSSRDVEIVTNPNSPWFGNAMLSEPSSYGYARILVAHSHGDFKTAFGNQYYPLPSTGTDPWYLSFARNGDLYVSNNTLRNIQVFRDTILMQTIQDTLKIGLPRGIAAYGAPQPTLLIATGRAVVRRTPAGVVDTIFADTAAGGYTRDVAVDDSGYVYVSFGGSSTTYKNVVRLSRTFVPIDTLTLPERVTHLFVFSGANAASNVDDIIYGRVLGANGGVFKLDFAAKTFTKLFTPSTSTSANHSIAVDVLGNIYYANPSAEWMRMYVAPSAAPSKFITNIPMNVGTHGTRVIDNFDKTAGHFNVHPTYSGSTTGVDASSTAAWTSMYSRSGTGGAVEIRLVDNAASSSDLSCRFLSGTGSPANNDSIAPFGWIGYWLKTNTAPAGAKVAIGMDDPLDPTTKRSVMLPVINDGEWHLYQWNVEDPTHWTPWVVTSGSSKIKGPRASIDAIWFMAPNGSQPWVMNLDNVSHNPFGMIGAEVGRGDVTGNGFVSVLDASWVLQHSVSLRTLSAGEIFAADVNLSDEGTATNAVDASVMLAHVVGKIPFLPWKQPLPPLGNVNGSEAAPVSLIIAAAKGSSGKIVNIPISIPQNLSGLRSAEMNVEFNSSHLKIRSVTTTTLTKDFTLASNMQNGSISIAMASGEAVLHGGQILMLEAEVLQSSDDILLTVKNISLNDIRILKVTSAGGVSSEIPTTYALQQNYPNPFNPTTTIEYQLPADGFVNLKIYDVSGREVMTLVSEQQDAGTHRMMWNGTDNSGRKIASGVYFCRLSVGTFTQIKKMVMIK